MPKKLYTNTCISLLFIKCFIVSYWKEIKKINPQTSSYLPNSIDGEKGAEAINSMFKSKYNDLFNEYNEYDESFFERINERISNKCLKDRCSSNHHITPDIIKLSIGKIKKGTLDPCFGVMSDSLKNAPDILFDKLSIFFQLKFSHSITIDIFNQSLIIPIPKDKRKSLSDSSNYRGIALSSIFCKLFEYILIFLCENVCKNNDLQFGFKKGFSTALCSFTISETIQYYKNNSSNVYILFLDASKAFDRVKHTKLFNCLLDKDLCPLFIRMIAIMYIANKAKVRWGNNFSDEFKMNNGVKQGGVLSPYLFALYLDPLLDMCHKSRLGCYMGDVPANAFAYADDVAIMAPSISSLKKLIHICENYSLEYSVNFNAKKSNLVCFGNFDIDLDIYINNEKIQVTNDCKHLGFYMKNSNHLYDIKDTIQNIKIRTNTICNVFQMLDWSCKRQLFKSQCTSLYGCELWDIRHKDIDQLEITWRQCSRKILNISNRTHNSLIYDLIDTKKVSTLIGERFINFMRKGLLHENIHVRFFFQNCLVNYNSYRINNLNYIIRNFHISYSDIFKTKKIILIDKKNETYKINMIKELLDVRDELMFNDLSCEETQILIDYLCIN